MQHCKQGTWGTRVLSCVKISQDVTPVHADLSLGFPKNLLYISFNPY